MHVKNWLGPGFESEGESRMVQAVLESQVLEVIIVRLMWLKFAGIWTRLISWVSRCGTKERRKEGKSQHEEGKCVFLIHL